MPKRYDFDLLPNPTTTKHIAFVQDLVRSVVGLDLALDLAGSDAGRELARVLAGSDAGRELALDLAGSDAGRQLARVLAGSDAGRALAHDLAGSRAGRALARVLAGSDIGRALARDLAGSEGGRALALDLAGTDAGRELARDLAESGGGRALIRDLAGSDGGRALALDLARSASLALVFELVRTSAGQALVQDLAGSEAGRALALDLAGSGGGRALIRDLAGRDALWALARVIAGSDGSLALAFDLAGSEGGRALARDLAGSDAGRALARDLAESEAGRALALDMSRGRVSNVIVVPSAGGSDTTSGALLLGAGALALVGLGVLPIATLMLAVPAWPAALILFVAGALTQTPDERSGGSDDATDDPDRVWSVDELYDVERVVGRLDTETADRLRARLEPFVGQVERFLADGRYPPGETSDQVEYEVLQLRRELFSENPVEPLGTVVYAYFTSLLQVTRPLLDEPQLRAAAVRAGVDGGDLVELVDAGTHEAVDPTDVTPAVDIANATKALAPKEITSDRGRAEWAATVVGWATDTAMKGGAGVGVGAAADAALKLTWLNPAWAAVIGGVLGIASAIAKIVRTEIEDDDEVDDEDDDGS